MGRAFSLPKLSLKPFLAISLSVDRLFLIPVIVAVSILLLIAQDCAGGTPFRFKALTPDLPYELQYPSTASYYPFSSDYFSFNDKDQAAFAAKVINPSGIFLLDGTNVQEVFLKKALTPDSPQINTQGHIAFRVYDKSAKKYALYFYDGKSSQKIYDDIQDFSLNAQGQIAFFSAGKLYLYDGTRVIDISSFRLLLIANKKGLFFGRFAIAKYNINKHK